MLTQHNQCLLHRSITTTMALLQPPPVVVTSIAVLALAVVSAVLRTRSLHAGDVMGTIERADPAFDELVPAGAQLTVVASGFQWAEGPVWWPAGTSAGSRRAQAATLAAAQRPGPGTTGALLFSDVKANTVYRWSDDDGLTVLRSPSGISTEPLLRTPLIEPGANGLYVTPDRLTLYACDHGNRRVYAVPLAVPDATAVATLADTYEGRRLNSPNDLTVEPRSGDLFFTDPSYGLKRMGGPAKGEQYPQREQALNRVYVVRRAELQRRAAAWGNGRAYDSDGRATGDATLVAPVELALAEPDTPNGLAFSPSGTKLYVASSNSSRPLWMVFDVEISSRGGSGDVATVDASSGRIFADAAQWKQGTPVGNPDGMAVDEHGNVWATGPGGVLVFNPEGKLLGRLLTGQKTGNVAFGGDGRLYVAADSYIARIDVTVRGAQYN